jgi:cell wall-associated NlpC family hydrolase
MGELEILTRAHNLFAADSRPVTLAAVDPIDRDHRYRHATDDVHQNLHRMGATDRELASIISRAQRDHVTARELTRTVVEAARAETTMPTDSPVAQREAMRRTVARLRTQQQHVLGARRRARRRLALLLLLRYGARRRSLGPRSLPQPGNRADVAVRAALSRLGMPYVWGATGPDRFDCSGLMQWAYRQAGVSLDRTTYDQIHHGVAVPRSLVQPGDLVFPHAGHVQMAIGNGMVVESPHAGATVRVSPLGTDVVIRRPT